MDWFKKAAKLIVFLENQKNTEGSKRKAKAQPHKAVGLFVYICSLFSFIAL
jgi:hypothetical protein